MAIKRRKTVARRSVAKRKPVARRARRTTKRSSLRFEVAPGVAREIWAIIYLAVAILAVLSIKGTFGLIGDSMINLLKPVFGWGIYVIPGIFGVISLMLFLSKKVVFSPARIFGIGLFMGSILSIFHLSVPIESLHTYAAEGLYGGYIGFVSNFILLEVLGVGQIAASIIFVAAFLVSVLLVFELSLGEIFRFLIPEIKIEMIKDDKNQRKVSKEDEMEAQELNLPEIQIRKADLKGVAKIYEDEDEGSKNEETAKIKINEQTEKSFSEQLTKNEKAAEAGEVYEWEFPSMDLLKTGDSNVQVDDELLMKNADTIKAKLQQFGIDVVMHEVNVGPTVIQYTLKPHEAVKLSKITTLKNDIALALAAERVRIEAPIPGKSLVGIEVPNGYRSLVFLKELIQSAQFTDSRSKLTLPLGRDVSGRPIVANLDAMPHLLVAGATGSGKSVCINSFLLSMLYQNSPNELKLILIDPKRVELGSYNNIPHLLSPVIQDPEKAAISL
ncbi:DNA translocase FtsK 4TM domain-containing protein, partial [Patescibacteria group bacterium]|nr:DNA translocase FtsK 4TM domain-containing protein [Patescibacteria group bacterium]